MEDNKINENQDLNEMGDISPNQESEQVQDVQSLENDNTCDKSQNENNAQEDKIQQLQNQVDQMKDLAQRTQAEFMNYKKRVAKEMQDISAFANERIITELLGVLDNFDRAIESEKDNDTPFLQGVVMIKKQLEDTLFKNGLKEIDALGQEFDPNYHHAVMQEESDDKNKVLEVLQKGYKLKEKVIRPSMVKVSQ